MYLCHACGKELAVDRKVGRREECPSCRADLHCCLNCAFYDPAAPKQCREPVAEYVKVKDKANFCDYFTFRDGAAPGAGRNEAQKAKLALDDLFRK